MCLSIGRKSNLSYILVVFVDKWANTWFRVPRIERAISHNLDLMFPKAVWFKICEFLYFCIWNLESLDKEVQWTWLWKLCPPFGLWVGLCLRTIESLTPIQINRHHIKVLCQSKSFQHAMMYCEKCIELSPCSCNYMVQLILNIMNTSRSVLKD